MLSKHISAGGPSRSPISPDRQVQASIAMPNRDVQVHGVQRCGILDPAYSRTGPNAFRKGLSMRTEFCQKLGIEFPIFAFSHCRDVVAAVSNAGRLGVLGAGWFSQEEIKHGLDWLDQHSGEHTKWPTDGGLRMSNRQILKPYPRLVDA